MLVSPLFQFDNAKVQKIQMQNNTFPQLFSINFNFRSTFGRLARPRTFGGFEYRLAPDFNARQCGTAAVRHW
jgi:hypothetical protein